MQCSWHTNTHSLCYLLMCVHFPHEALRQRWSTQVMEPLRTQSVQLEDLCAAIFTPELQSMTDIQLDASTEAQNLRWPNSQTLLLAVPITLYSLNCLSASFMNTACVPGVQLPESIWMYWTPTYESNHKVYIQEQGCYGHLRGAVKITLVICSPGSKQSGNIWE